MYTWLTHTCSANSEGKIFYKANSTLIDGQWKHHSISSSITAISTTVALFLQSLMSTCWSAVGCGQEYHFYLNQLWVFHSPRQPFPWMWDGTIPHNFIVLWRHKECKQYILLPVTGCAQAKPATITTYWTGRLTFLWCKGIHQVKCFQPTVHAVDSRYKFYVGTCKYRQMHIL